MFVSLNGNITVPLKYKVQMSGKTDVNHGLELPVILKEILLSSRIFARIYGTHTSFITQNGRKAVDLASTAVAANVVCFIA